MVDEHKWFDQEVLISAGPHTYSTASISNTRLAAEFLLYKWPEKRGAKHLAARKACIEVLEGLKEARAARKAFMEAAKEADILCAVQPKPRPSVALKGRKSR